MRFAIQSVCVYNHSRRLIPVPKKAGANDETQKELADPSHHLLHAGVSAEHVRHHHLPVLLHRPLRPKRPDGGQPRPGDADPLQHRRRLKPRGAQRRQEPVSQQGDQRGHGALRQQGSESLLQPLQDVPGDPGLPDRKQRRLLRLSLHPEAPRGHQQPRALPAGRVLRPGLHRGVRLLRLPGQVERPAGMRKRARPAGFRARRVPGARRLRHRPHRGQRPHLQAGARPSPV